MIELARKCGRRSSSKKSGELDDLSKKILAALSEFSEPVGCGDIAKKIGEKVQRVMGKLRSLKNKGFVESPVKGKYVISSEGLKLVKG